MSLLTIVIIFLALTFWSAMFFLRFQGTVTDWLSNRFIPSKHPVSRKEKDLQGIHPFAYGAAPQKQTAEPESEPEK